MEEKKKIVFVTGGATFWNRERQIINELNKKVDLLLVIMHYPSGNYASKDIVDFCKRNKVQVHIEDFGKKRARHPSRIIKDFRLCRKIKKFGPHVVYIESFGSPYFAILNRLILGNRRTVMAIMDYKLHPRTLKGFRFSEQFYRFAYLHFYKYFQFFSYAQARYFEKENPTKINFVIRLFLVGTDLKKTQRKKKKREINFLFFGRIYYYKGVDVLIEAGNILAKNSSDFTITIAGNCDVWESEYKKLIKAWEVFELDIRFIPKAKLPEYFQNADFFVAPYREVTQSGPLLRAYYYDLIPIVSDEEGFTEYVENGKNGFIFKSESSESLAEVMKNALSLNLTQKERISKEIAIFKNEEFDIERVAQKYINMFDEIVIRNKRKESNLTMGKIFK